jgi:cephalosporin hydroxylase
VTHLADQTSHDDYVPNAHEYRAAREQWRAALGADSELREQAVQLQVSAEKHKFTYQWEWAGVPVIRLPDDVMVLQELFWEYRPQRVVEAGVARGGGLILDASLMRLTGETPAVLGVDHKIFPHTASVLSDHPLAEGVETLEADSTSDEAVLRVVEFLGDAERAVLILDSNHTHDHVLAELRTLAPLLPVGSFVVVADTLIEEFPEGHYEGRPWGRGNNPLSAVRQFLAETPSFVAEEAWSRRGLMSESRDGFLRRTA